MFVIVAHYCAQNCNDNSNSKSNSSKDKTQGEEAILAELLFNQVSHKFVTITKEESKALLAVLKSLFAKKHKLIARNSTLARILK